MESKNIYESQWHLKKQKKNNPLFPIYPAWLRHIEEINLTAALNLSHVHSRSWIWNKSCRILKNEFQDKSDSGAVNAEPIYPSVYRRDRRWRWRKIQHRLTSKTTLLCLFGVLGLPTVVKLVDKETLLRERDEKKSVSKHRQCLLSAYSHESHNRSATETIN